MKEFYSKKLKHLIDTVLIQEYAILVLKILNILFSRSDKFHVNQYFILK